MRIESTIKRLLAVVTLLGVTMQTTFAQSERLPVVRLTGNGLSSSYSEGTFQLEDGTVFRANIRHRGATAQRYTKKSFTVKLKDEAGEKLNASFLGMRSDNTWILDAMAIDVARMRNRVATDLWLDFATQPYYYDQEPKLVNGTHGQFVEVYVNGAYEGLYCMTEKVDRKQLKLKKSQDGNIRGILYKLVGWDFMGSRTEAEYVYDNTKTRWGVWEAKYPDVDEGEPFDWEPLARTIRWLSTAGPEAVNDSLEEVVDMPLWRDYFLLLDLMLGNDNAGKNMYVYFYNLQKPEQKMAVVPWDMDATWGRDPWARPLAADTETGLYHQLQYHFLYVRNDSAQIYYPRYVELRKSYFAAEKLKSYFEKYFRLFRETGAGNREQERWNGVDGFELDFAAEEQYIYKWIDDRLAYLDSAYCYHPEVPEGIAETFAGTESPEDEVYTLSGQRVGKAVGGNLKTLQLPRGLYIWNRRKILIK